MLSVGRQEKHTPGGSDGLAEVISMWLCLLSNPAKQSIPGGSRLCISKGTDLGMYKAKSVDALLNS